MNKTVEAIELHRLRIPLKTPYHVAFVRFDAFEVFLARVFGEGGEGIGEAATAPGQSQRHEAGDVIWETLRRSSEGLIGTRSDDALKKLSAVQDEHPYAAAALATAIENLASPPELREDVSVPLLGTILTHDDDALEGEIEALLDTGYRTLKVKVGWDERDDVARTQRIQEIVGDRALIRIDANQGYDFAQAKFFAERVDPSSVEVFEQPFPIDRWDDMQRLAGISRLPLMLDESIVTLGDLERAIDLRCAQAIKFKLMRAAGFDRLKARIRLANEAGLKVILGNGVASDIGDFHELLVAAELVETAGEMNGFLKQESRLISNPYDVTDGQVSLQSGYQPQLDWDKIESYEIDAFSTERAASTRPSRQ